MNTGQLVVSVAGLAALGYTLVNFLRSLCNLGDKANRSAAISQAISFAVFVGLVFLAGADRGAFGQLQVIEGTALNDMSAPGKVIVGLMLAGTAGAFHKFIQARDNTDTAAVSSFLK